MPAYVIAQIEYLDEDLTKAYRAIAQATVAQYGGRYPREAVPWSPSKASGRTRGAW